MKKFLFTAFLFFAGLTATFAQAKISFDKLVNDFGTFSENNPVQKCTFTFTNTGDKPLIINQASASCGCTVANYTKTPIKPGKKGTVTVTYNGKGLFPGHFKKAITVRSNGIPMITRIYIEGVMSEAKEK